MNEMKLEEKREPGAWERGSGKASMSLSRTNLSLVFDHRRKQYRKELLRKRKKKRRKAERNGKMRTIFFAERTLVLLGTGRRLMG